MTVTTGLVATLVDPPTRAPFPYGLFSVVPFRPAGDGRWQGGVTWEALSCGPIGSIGPYNCEDPSATVGLPKDLTLNHPLSGEATPFTVYGVFRCSPAGWPPASAQERATQHLNAREETAAEWALWTGDLGNVPNFEDDATDVGGGTVTPSVGLALLEQFIVDHYGSLGVIHMSRGVAEILLGRQLLKASGSSLTTQVGTPVVAGGGYPGTGPGGAGASPGTAWIMASPALFGYRSEVFTSSNRGGDLLDRSTNDMLAVAERTYLYGYDPCGVGAALIGLADAAPSSAPGDGGPTLTLSIGTQPGSPVPEGTDVTVTVQASAAPTQEVHLHARLNGGPWTDLGEMTEVNPQEFVYNQQTTGASGDTYDLFATSGSATSPTITVAVS